MDGKSAFRHGPKASAAGGQAAGSLAAGHSSPFIVALKKDGGAAGTSTTACTWTYTLYPIGGTTAGTNFAGATLIAPYNRQAAFGAWQQAPDGSYGLASYLGGTWYLWEAFKEYPLTEACA